MEIDEKQTMKKYLFETTNFQMNPLLWGNALCWISVSEELTHFWCCHYFHREMDISFEKCPKPEAMSCFFRCVAAYRAAPLCSSYISRAKAWK